MLARSNHFQQAYESNGFAIDTFQDVVDANAVNGIASLLITSIIAFITQSFRYLIAYIIVVLKILVPYAEPDI